MVVTGITKCEPRTDTGASGRSGVATVGRRQSGGPSFNSGRSRPLGMAGFFTVRGVTYDSVGAPLASCPVYLLSIEERVIEATTVSDGSGAFSFTVGNNARYRVGVATGSGVAGATIGPLTYTAT